jgi:hypothetical protein
MLGLLLFHAKLSRGSQCVLHWNTRGIHINRSSYITVSSASAYPSQRAKQAVSVTTKLRLIHANNTTRRRRTCVPRCTYSRTSVPVGSAPPYTAMSMPVNVPPFSYVISRLIKQRIITEGRRERRPRVTISMLLQDIRTSRLLRSE